MSGERYEIGRRRLLRATGAGIASASALSTGVGASAAAQAEQAPDEDDFDDILSEMDGEGTESDPYVVTDVVELQAISGDVTAHYLLGNDIDASATAEWNDGAGFEPIVGRADNGDGSGDSGGSDDGSDGDGEETPAEFVGSLQGDGHEISGLTIDRPEEFSGGLVLINQGLIVELSLTNASVVGEETGIVAASNGGGIGRVSVEGELDGTDNSGGIAGGSNGQIIDCEAAVDVTGGAQVGGLVGTNTGGIADCVADGAVEGTDNVGGLVGQTSGNVEASTANGSVTGENRVGGFVGDSGAGLSACVATGDVSGDSIVGGFAGESWGQLLGVTAEGDVEGAEHVGGLVGENYGEVRVCSVLGDVSGSANVGGVLGWGAGGSVTTDVFAVGSVDGESAAGALVGLLGGEFLDDSETVAFRRGYWNTEGTATEPVGLVQTGDGEVELVEETISGLESAQFVGEDVAEAMPEFDFEQQWRAFPDDYPRPRAQVSSVFEILDVSSTQLVVRQDETFEMTLEVENTAEWEGTQTIALVIDGDVVQSVDQQLDPGESTQVAFDTLSASEIPVGSYTFAVQTRDDSVEGTIQVESASGSGDGDDGEDGDDGQDGGDGGDGGDTPPTGTDDPDDADDDGPGFGIAAGLTGVGTGAYLLARRLDDEPVDR